MFILVGMFLVDVVGRRPLLITSAAGVVAGLAFITMAYIVQPPLILLAAAGLSFFMASFSVGYGPLTGVFLGEVFPLGVRYGRSLRNTSKNPKTTLQNPN